MVDLYAGRRNECQQNSLGDEARRLIALDLRFSRYRSSIHENMLKYVILVSTLACLAYSQRPSYAGSAGRYPVVLPQYTRTPAPTVGSSTVGSPTVGSPIVESPNAGSPIVGSSNAGSPIVGNPSVGNRIDSLYPEPGTSYMVGGSNLAVPTTVVPFDLPVEAYGDVDLVNRIKTWPRDQQPFWFINQVSINAHRGSGNVPGTATQAPQTMSRSFFSG